VQDLDYYCAAIEGLHKLTNDMTKQVPNFQDWKRRNRRKNAAVLLAIPLFLGVVIAGFNFAGQAYWRHLDKVEKIKAEVTPSPPPR
jgi:ABC-type transport system involved in cytochrome c biogenesis permease subunit